MRNYTLGLDKENGSGHVTFVLALRAKNMTDAVMEWARITGHLGPLFNAAKRKYFCWDIVETTQKPLERKSSDSWFFSY